MYNYTTVQWIFIFFFYCFGGWVCESAFVSFKAKKFINRGFVRGPFLPIYGCGATMMLVVSKPFQNNIICTYFAGVVGATLLEYVSGVLMEKLFKVRYWDYSKLKFNFQGQICLRSSVAWGFYTVAMTRFINKPVENFMYQIPLPWLTRITWLVTSVFCMDFALSFKAALDIRDILIKMSNAKREMERISKRLDVIIAVTCDEMSNKKDEIYENFAQKRVGWATTIGGKPWDLKAKVGDKFDSLKNLASLKPIAYLEGIKDELFDLKLSYSKLSESSTGYLSSFKEFFKRDIIVSNPDMISKEYEDSLEELRDSINHDSQNVN